MRQTLGYLSQEFGIYPKSRAEDMLEHFAILKGVADKKTRRDVVEALLRQTNLWDVRRQKLGGFSGGMKQRFGVAVALLGNPKLMIVDEPTAGLDPAERELLGPTERREYGLPARPLIPSLYDAPVGEGNSGGTRFEAVIGTSEDQIGIAQGALLRSWTEGGRRYTRYETDAPIGGEVAFYSADYAVREEQ